MNEKNNHTPHLAPMPDASSHGLNYAGPAVADPSSSHSHVPTHYPARTGRKSLIFGLAVVIGLAAIFVFRHVSNAREEAPLEADLQKAANEPITVDVIHVKTGAPERALTLPGEARPFCDSTVFARTSGYLNKYFVDIGDRVKSGQTLATIETPELDDQIAAAKAKVQQLNAEVNVVQTSCAFAKISFQRWAASSGDGAVSVQERDQKKSELDSSLAKLEAARAEVALAEADLHRLLTMDKFKVVTAPFEGTITDRRVDVGDLVSAGSTSNTTPLFSIAQSNQMRVFVDVPQAAAAEIGVGTSAVASYAGRDFAGTVDRTAEMINLSSRTLKVEVLVPNPNHELLPGTYLQVTFQLSRALPPMQIPSSALIWRTSGPQAAVVNADGHVKFIAVKIIRDMGDLVEVQGLNINDRVALNIGSQAPDGGQVQAHEVDTPQHMEPRIVPKEAVALPTPVRQADAQPAADKSHKVVLTH